MERYLREVICKELILNSPPPPIHEFIIYLLIKPMLSIFTLAINLIDYFWPFFKVFIDL